MKILVVRWGTLESFPPAINLVKALVGLGHDVTVVANGVNGALGVPATATRVDLGDYPRPGEGGWIGKRLHGRSILRGYLKNNVDVFDLIWTTSDNSAIYCIDLVPPEKHVLQLAELVEYVPLIGSASLFRSKRFVEHARKVKLVVVPEKNRAFIQRAWWDLPVVPAVLPNKPAIRALPELVAESQPSYLPILQGLERQGKRVVLYQGGFTPDRDLETYCEAVEMLGDDWEFCLMGPENDYLKKLCSDHRNTTYIGAYPPPLHLYAGKHALVGVLPYRSNPERIAHLSPLNSLYCAPNKLWEYALVGLPMVANDLPGLRYAIESNDMGAIASEGDVGSVAEAILKVAAKHDELSRNSMDFYDGFDFDGAVEKIVRCSSGA